MSKYNHFAKDLDVAFKAARDEYISAYNALEGVRQRTREPGMDPMKKQLAALQLQEAESTFKKENSRIWEQFDAKAAELGKALEQEVKAGSLADPDAVDNGAIKLMETGVLSADDFYSFADRYSENPTMLKLIGHYAKEAAENTDNRKDAVALRVLSQECEKGRSKVMKSWDDLISAVNYCSGRGANGTRRNSPGVTISMGTWWEQLAGETVENF